MSTTTPTSSISSSVPLSIDSEFLSSPHFSSFSALFSSFRDRLVCSICLQLVARPISFPCLHIFCSECCNQLFLTNHQENQTKVTSADKRDSIPCPCCRCPAARRQLVADPLINKVSAITKKISEIIGDNEGNEIQLLINQIQARPNANTQKISDSENDHTTAVTRTAALSSTSSSTASDSVFTSISPRYSLVHSTNFSGRVCEVCCSGEEFSGDELVCCRGPNCGILLHRSCYGIPEENSDEENNSAAADSAYYCSRCSSTCTLDVSCVLCGVSSDRAFKRTLDGRFIHVTCALFHSEPIFVEPRDREPVDKWKTVNPDRFKLKCRFCVNWGACVQCSFGRCCFAFHPACGPRNGIMIEYETRRKSTASANNKGQEKRNQRRHETEDCDSASDSESDDGEEIKINYYCKQHQSIITKKRARQNPPDASNSEPQQKQQPQLQQQQQERNVMDEHKNKKQKLDKKKLVILTSSLDSTQAAVVTEFVNLFDGAILKEFSSSVTHLIVPADPVTKRTFKFFQAILSRRWILPLQWISECVKQRRIIDEEPYLVSGDSKFTGGPKKARENAESKFFAGHCFLIVADEEANREEDLWSRPELKSDLRQLLEMGGATVESRWENVRKAAQHSDFKFAHRVFDSARQQKSIASNLSNSLAPIFNVCNELVSVRSTAFAEIFDAVAEWNIDSISKLYEPTTKSTHCLS